MKTLRIAGYIVIIAALVGGLAYGFRRDEVRQFTASFNGEKETYRAHHQPTPNWYYSVESVSVTDGKTFIIGRNMQPVMKQSKTGETLISLEPNDKLREIEVPSKKIGLKAGGAFFTVKTVDGVPTLIYFTSQQEVIKSMIQAKDIPSAI